MRHPLAPRALAPVALLAASCTQPLRLTPVDAPAPAVGAPIAAPDPGARGALPVRTLYYGSGTDKRRAVYRDSVAIRTKPVDASKLVSMAPGVAKSRKKTWGFDSKAFPLNARVWYPDAEGRFPLVLVVHGNHDPTDYSDPGYGWFGEHLASRGFIVASIDENFLNGGLRGENDGRAWMLLKHLERWRAWNDSAAGPFRGKVDMGAVGLVGHSRGGEAVAHAATFNRLARYPDDATLTFDFGFAIRAVVAIAPVDGQYRPAGQWMPLENVNYLVVHGSHDGDVTNFHGLRQYQRLRFTDGGSWLKSAWYVYRANHGQWNTVWGNKDNGPFSARRLDLRGLLDAEEQRQFGRVVMGAFLEATLKGRREYLPMFRDPRLAAAWLPRTMYHTRFGEGSFRPIAHFDEDVDPATGTVRGVRLQGDSLSTWREGTLRFRGGEDPMNTNAAWLGWNNRVVGADTARRGTPARFTITLPDSLGRDRAGDALLLSLAVTREVPGPRAAPKDTTKRDSAGRRSPSAEGRAPKSPSDTLLPMDLTIELEDATGRVARRALSRYGPVRRPLEARVLRRADREKTQFPNTFELVPQTYVMPVADLVAETPGFDAARVRAVRLVFDRTPSGTVVVDDVGFSRLGRAYYALGAGR